MKKSLYSKAKKGGLVNNTGYLKGKKTNKNKVNVIPSSRITTENMAFPIYANGQPLYPNTGEYDFDTPYVVETPMQKGGKLVVPKGDPRYQSYQDSLTLYDKAKQLQGLVQGEGATERAFNMQTRDADLKEYNEAMDRLSAEPIGMKEYDIPSDRTSLAMGKKDSSVVIPDWKKPQQEVVEQEWVNPISPVNKIPQRDSLSLNGLDSTSVRVKPTDTIPQLGGGRRMSGTWGSKPNPLLKGMQAGGNINRFNTRLKKDQLNSYNEHSELFKGLKNDKFDYDTQGFYKEIYKENKGDFDAITKALTPGSPTAHVGTDKYKKPNHPTFSNQSKYTLPLVRRGGEWGSDDEGDYFNATRRNIKNMNKSDGSPLKYFQRAEDYDLDGTPDVNLKYKGNLYEGFQEGGNMGEVIPRDETIPEFELPKPETRTQPYKWDNRDTVGIYDKNPIRRGARALRNWSDSLGNLVDEEMNMPKNGSLADAVQDVNVRLNNKLYKETPTREERTKKLTKYLGMQTGGNIAQYGVPAVTLAGGIMEGAENDNVSLAGSTISGAGKGAAMGSMFGPLGMGVGAGIGAGVSLVKGIADKKQHEENERKRMETLEKQRKDLKTINDTMALQQFPTEGLDGNYFQAGGYAKTMPRLGKAIGGKVKKLSSDAHFIKGNDPSKDDGVKFPQSNIALDDKEVVKDGFVHSKDYGFADEVAKLEKEKGKLEKSKTMRNRLRIREIDRQVEQFALEQEMNKKSAGMENDIDGNSFKCGGKIHKRLKKLL